MELYLLKSTACLAILFSFYKLLLENETNHTFKRFYLLGALFLSFGIPLLTFTSYIESSSAVSYVFSSEEMASEAIETTNYLPLILWTIYSLGVLSFSLKFFRNLSNLIQKIKNNPKFKANHITNVLLNDPVTPHTFFSYIFLNKQKFEAREIPSEVILHEETHALQKHSLDVLIIELLQIVFWFNPFIHLTRQSIKLNHEFLADRAVLKNGVETVAYQNLLLAFSSNAVSPQLANSINYSSIKKRFTVMKTHTSKRGVLLRNLVLLPLLGMLIFGFSAREIVAIEAPLNNSALNQDKANPDQIEAYNKMAAFWNNYFIETYPERIIPLSELQKLEAIYRTLTPQQRAAAEPFPECNPAANPGIDQATPEQIAEYNKLAKHYNAMSRDQMFIKKKDVDRLKYLYNLMTVEQRKNAEPFPDFPPPPPSIDAPDTMEVIPAPPPPPSDKNIWEFEEKGNVPPPPPPPDPEEPLDHIISMSKKGAEFFYEGSKISSDQAIKLLKKNRSLNIQTTNVNSNKPTVKLSKEPGKFVKKDKSNKPAKVIKGSYKYSPTNLPPPPPIVRQDPVDHIVRMAYENAAFFYENKAISSNEAIELVKKDENLHVETTTFEKSNPIVNIFKQEIRSEK